MKGSCLSGICIVKLYNGTIDLQWTIDVTPDTENCIENWSAVANILSHCISQNQVEFSQFNIRMSWKNTYTKYNIIIQCKKYTQNCGVRRYEYKCNVLWN